MRVPGSLAWPDRFFPFFFGVENGKKRSGHARLGSGHSGVTGMQTASNSPVFMCIRAGRNDPDRDHRGVGR